MAEIAVQLLVPQIRHVNHGKHVIYQAVHVLFVLVSALQMWIAVIISLCVMLSVLIFVSLRMDSAGKQATAKNGKFVILNSDAGQPQAIVMLITNAINHQNFVILQSTNVVLHRVTVLIVGIVNHGNNATSLQKDVFSSITSVI